MFLVRQLRVGMDPPADLDHLGFVGADVFERGQRQLGFSPPAVAGALRGG